MIYVVFFIFLLSAFVMFFISDFILRVQHARHFKEWEADGRPYGFFFVPRELGFLGVFRVGSWLATQRRLLSLTFKTPAWAYTEPKVISLLWVYRGMHFIGFGLWLLFAYLTLTKNG